MSDEAERIGGAIRTRRQARNWTVYRLAQRAGISAVYLSSLEEGKGSRPGVQIVARLARALGVTTDALLIESGLMEPPADWQAGRQPLDVYLRETSPLRDDDIHAVTHLVRRLSESAERYETDSEQANVDNLAAHPVDEEAERQRRIAEGWVDEEPP